MGLTTKQIEEQYQEALPELRRIWEELQARPSALWQAFKPSPSEKIFQSPTQESGYTALGYSLKDEAWTCENHAPGLEVLNIASDQPCSVCGRTKE